MRLTRGFLVLFLAVPLFAAKLVDLTITERAGVARTNEPILMGVPLPESFLMSDTSRFTLRDASNAIIPCEFRVATTWLKHRTAIRFLHLDFQTSLTASQSKVVSLNSESAPYSATSSLTVQDNGTSITVNTGVLKFIVRKAKFNLIDQAWIDETGNKAFDAAHQIIATHENGLTHKRLTTDYSSINDNASTVVIERKGPMATVLKATGTLKTSGGQAGLRFVTRLYAYNNSKIVRIENTIENVTEPQTACTYITDLKAVLPLSLSSKSVLVGKAGGSDAATLAGTENTYIFSRRKAGAIVGVDVVTGGKITNAVFNPVLTKPRDMGWMSLYDGSKGVAAGFNHFWEMYPQGLEADASGNLVIKFYSERSANNLQVFAGISRTQEVRLVFFNDDAAADQRAQVTGVSNRLYAVAPVDWYCQKTYALGLLVPPRQSLYAASDWTVVQNLETKFTTHWNAVRSEVSSRLGLDTYGYLSYGDGLHYLWGDGTNPWNRSYDGNYYDLPHMAFQSFARSGDITHLEHGNVNANHIEDVHQYHAPGALGGCRYCPATNHCTSDAPSNDSAHVHAESHASHHKTQSMFENWLLLGDRRALETCVQAWDWLGDLGISAGQGEDIDVYCRRCAHMMHSLCYAYSHTKKAKYLTQLTGLFSNLHDWIGVGGTIGQTFMWGFLMEGMVDYYHLLEAEPIAANYSDTLDLIQGVMFQTYQGASTADNVALDLLIWASAANRIQYGYANTAIGYGFLARTFEDATLRDVCITKVNVFQSGKYANTNKDFALHGRSIHRALYYLAKPDSLPLPLEVEKTPTAIETAEPAKLVVIPNPSNPSTVIRLNGNMGIAAQTAILSIYDIKGVLVKQVKTDVATLTNGYRWDAKAMPAGVYTALVKTGKRTLSHKITLLK